MDESDEDLYGKSTTVYVAATSNVQAESESLPELVPVQQEPNIEEEQDEESDDDLEVVISTTAPPRLTTLNPSQPAQTTEKGIDINKPGVIDDKSILDYEYQGDKPWTKPGADITDYFNYGFTEKTWEGYKEKQRAIRDGAINPMMGMVNMMSMMRPGIIPAGMPGIPPNMMPPMGMPGMPFFPPGMMPPGIMPPQMVQPQHTPPVRHSPEFQSLHQQQHQSSRDYTQETKKDYNDRTSSDRTEERKRKRKGSRERESRKSTEDRKERGGDDYDRVKREDKERPSSRDREGRDKYRKREKRELY